LELLGRNAALQITPDVIHVILGGADLIQQATSRIVAALKERDPARQEVPVAVA